MVNNIPKKKLRHFSHMMRSILGVLGYNQDSYESLNSYQSRYLFEKVSLSTFKEDYDEKTFFTINFRFKCSYILNGVL